MIKIDLKKYNNFYNENEIMRYDRAKRSIKDEFENGSLKQWLDVNTYIKKNELERIREVANSIREYVDTFIVIGIGGSYMGAKAVISALTPKFKSSKPEIIFFGTNLNSEDYNELIEYIKDKSIAVNVISKSGTTLEPSLAFETILDLMKTKYSDLELKKRIFITTDAEKGKLRELSKKYGYESFVVPSKVGGRYSVLTPVGLLPIAVAGIDVEKLLTGAKKTNSNYDDALNYAIIRDICNKNGKEIESYTIYNEKLLYFGEWLKQLFAESQGKNKKGIFPISNYNTRDLHSLGQFLQEGTNIVFETVISIQKEKSFVVPNYNYELNDLNNIAVEAVAKAHANGNTPSNIIYVEELNEESIGEMIQFFILACIFGGRLLNVNPFDQPGVEEYKKLIKDELEKLS